ncbi:unnamed protein product [Pleuronectes platessa]|uniref:Uncharacterized protein n=1 Tax=Pleuronectes platessa TaxID=8262 RepID=A0A9N7TW69_PLEPL|nr:unnamed protein product [Pleuronectes platessa]
MQHGPFRPGGKAWGGVEWGAQLSDRLHPTASIFSRRATDAEGQMEGDWDGNRVEHNALGAGPHGKWATKNERESERDKSRRGGRSVEEMESQGVLGMEGGGGEGGKVWKLADRTGCAQTESRAQAQT